MRIECKCCHRTPDELSEYKFGAEYSDCTPEEYVINEEGTYNHITGKFYCTSCYIKLGCPSGKA